MSEFQKAMGSLKGALGVLKYQKSMTASTKLNIPQLSGFVQKYTEEKIEEMMNEVRQGFLEIAVSPDDVAKIYVKEIKENKLYICDNKEYFNILCFEKLV